MFASASKLDSITEPGMSLTTRWLFNVTSGTEDRKTERQESNRRSIEIRQSVEFTKRGMKEERGEGWLSPQMWFHPHPENLYAAPVS